MTTSGARAVVVLLAVLGCAGSARAQVARGPLVPPTATPRACTLATTNLSGTVTLQSDCVYTGQTLRIQQSNTTLDCNGARLTGASTSIVVRGQIDNVTVKNCYIADAGGITVTSPKRLAGETDDQLRARSPTHVVITHMSIENAKSVGVFFGPCVVGPIIENSVIEHSGSTGVYLEYGTQHAVVKNDLIANNGLVANGIERLGWTRREGLAIDASAYDTVEGNDFQGNGFGGVFLYKNCWEHHSTDPKSIQRLQHAHANTIQGNTFSEMPFGVWVAARQARDLATWDCGDPTPYPNPIALSEAFPPDYPTFRSTYPGPYDYNVDCLYNALAGKSCLGGCSTTRTAVYIWPDFAEDNVIEGNRFQHLDLAGVRVEDDRTRILDNHFVGDFDYVYVGTPFRSRYLKHPVLDTVITGNTYESANPATRRFWDQVVLVPGEHRGTQLGTGTASCKLPWGGTLPHLGQVRAWQAPMVATCRSQWRTCIDGTLTGAYTYVTCGPPGSAAPVRGCQAAPGPAGGGRTGWLWLLAIASLLGRRSRTPRQEAHQA